jgi:uncharacterized protein YjaZ
MEILVQDTPNALLALLERPVPARAEILAELLKPMYANVPVRGEPIDLHHQGGGFRVDLDDERYLPAVRRMVDEGVTGQIERELHRAWKALTDAHPAIRAPEVVRVVLMLGNPDDQYLTSTTGGYYGMGGVPGWIYLLAWPSDDVVGRIAHCAVHEFHHQVRYHNVEWNPVTVTVGEHVVAEGLAEAFVRELSGVDAMGPWSKMVTGNDFDRAYAAILADADLAGMQHTPAYVLGDTASVKFGGQPRGIPDMAGYAVGLRLVDKHLAETGLTVAQSTTLPGAEILRHSR